MVSEREAAVRGYSFEDTESRALSCPEVVKPLSKAARKHIAFATNLRFRDDTHSPAQIPSGWDDPRDRVETSTTRKERCCEELAEWL